MINWLSGTGSYYDASARPKWGATTWLAVCLLALYPLVPMPIAGGTKYQIALLCALGVLYILRGQFLSIGKPQFIFLCLSFLLLTWEIIAASFHGSDQDFLYVLGRGLWILNSFLVVIVSAPWVRQGRLDILVWLISLSLLFLLCAMVIESTFFPKREIGRQLGAINIPFPRATGVPNSDGKIGTFLIICWSFYLFVRPVTARWQSLVLGFGPILGLAFLQSRSTLMAFAVTFAIYQIVKWASSRSLVVTTIRSGFLVATLILVFGYSNQIIGALTGEGIYYKNVEARFTHIEYGFSEITEAPLFGAGAHSVRDESTESGIHNTTLAMSVKSGIPAGILITLITLGPILIFRRVKFITGYVAACSLGVMTEHLWYPGFINEFLIFSLLLPLTVCNFERQKFRAHQA